MERLNEKELFTKNEDMKKAKAFYIDKLSGDKYDVIIEYNDEILKYGYATQYLNKRNFKKYEFFDKYENDRQIYIIYKG